VDFARSVDLTEFVRAVTIPAGSYVSATLNVDYTNADIRVDDGTGTPVAVPLANIRDTQNRQVTTLPMKVTLDNARQLVIAPLVSSLRARAEELRAAELARFRSRLAVLDPAAQEAVEALTRGLVNKLLHDPTVRVKEAAGTAQGDMYADALAALFGLEDPSEPVDPPADGT